jgi:hypothetical protein
MRFSNRIGARPLPTSGLEEASKGLRSDIWNFYQWKAAAMTGPLKFRLSILLLSFIV